MEVFQTVQDRMGTRFSALKERFHWHNPMETTHIIKVVISSGVGRMKDDKHRHAVVQDRLTKITGQKPKFTQARKSIASFKLRQGETVGYMVTLNDKKKMHHFLTRLFFIALPRSRDFRGIPLTAVSLGELTVGIPEHIIFPEVSDEDLKDIFGLAVTIVTTAKTQEEAVAFFQHIGAPLKKK